MRIRRSLPADIRRAFRLDLGRGRAPAREAELDDEIRFHLEQRVAELVGKGWSQERAEAEAIARFGPYQESRNQLLDAAHSRDEVLTIAAMHSHSFMKVVCRERRSLAAVWGRIGMWSAR